MRIVFIITYFVLLIAVCAGIGALSAEEVYEREGKVYHQKIFGFNLEIPDDWHVLDKGEISNRGDYLIIIGPDYADNAKIYMSF